MKFAGALLAIVLALALPRLALGQGTPVYQDGTMVPGHLAKFLTNGRISDAGVGIGDAGNLVGAPIVPSNSDLGITSTATAPNGIWRLDFAAGNGAPPLFYRPSGAACSLNSGGGDNGSQVKSSDGKCWLAAFDASGASVKEWGARCDGLANDTSAINTAMASGYPLLLFPATPCLVGLLNSPAALQTLRGVSEATSTIKTSSATGDVLPLSNPGIIVERLGFDSSVTRTAGCYVHFKSGDTKLRNFFMNVAYCAFQVEDAISIVTIDKGYIYNSLGAGQAVVQFGSVGTVASGATAVYFGNTVMNSGTPAQVNIAVNNVGDLLMDNMQVLSADTNLEVSPVSGQAVVSLKCIHSFFDHGGTMMRVEPTGTGYVARSAFDDCWFASGTVNNVVMLASGSAYIDGVRFNNSESFLSTTGYGLQLNGNVRNTQWIGGAIAANSVGVFDSRAAGFNGLIITGSCIGACGGLGGNTTGISRGSAGDYADISHNNLRGNTGTAYGTTNTGTHNRVEKNQGYNSIGDAVPTVSASPWSIAIGETEATLYSFGGTISSVTINGTAIFSAAGNPLVMPVAANDVVVITYTVAPIVHVQRH